MTITRNQFITEWQKDLRSGEYHQGKGQLVEGGDNYCCLGVACETGLRLGILDASLETGDQGPNDPMPGKWFYDLFGSRDPAIDIPDDEYNNRDSLSGLNDDREWDFYQIADGLDQLRE